MFEDYYKLVGVHVIYFLLVETGFYKFGITGNIYSRLQTHARTLKFAEIVGIFECPSRQSSFRIEQKFKKYARDIGILVKKYEKTEIICTYEPQKYVEWFRREIQEETESLGALAIMDDVDFAPRIPRARPQFDMRNFRGLQQLLVQPVKIPKVRRATKSRSKKLAAVNLLEIAHTPVVTINDKTCENCGTSFRTTFDFARHRRRKIPCLIREVSIAEMNNPNRCIYCNRILSKKEHLTRHLTKCKLKNTTRKMLYDKAKHDEEIQTIREEHKREIEALRNAMDEKLNRLKEQITAHFSKSTRGT